MHVNTMIVLVFMFVPDFYLSHLLVVEYPGAISTFQLSFLGDFDDLLSIIMD